MSSKVPKLRFDGFSGEWEEKKLGDVYEFIPTNSLSRDKLNYEKGNVKNIHYGDIHTKFATLFNITKEKVPYINESVNIEKVKKESYCLEGDMIFADASEDLDDIGKSIEIININNEKLLSGLHTLHARQKKEAIIKGFSGYLFKSNHIKNQIKREAQGAKVLGLSVRRLEKTTIIFPKDPKEQQKIANCLSSLDNLIESQNKKVKALEKHKKGLMQNLFPKDADKEPKLRFDEFSGEWEEKEIGELFKVTRGEVLSMLLTKKNSSKDTPYPVYSSQTKNNGLAGYYSDYLFEDAITWTTDGANAGDVNYREGRFYCTNVCGVLINKDGYANQFMAEILNTVIKKHVSYVGNPKLMNGVMAKISIPIPTLNEQKKIANCLSSLDNLIESQNKKIKTLKKHKKGLMQQLFVHSEH